MSTTAVEKGLQFEKAVVDMLNNCGFKAWRTNQSNEADPEKYKAGFDGGVDIIATFDVVKPICRNVCFYIQCKCHKEPLTKSAISEVYAGMHARKGTTVTSLPVVFDTSDASQETMQFAKDLGAELFLKNEFTLVKDAESGLPVPYGNYGHKKFFLICYICFVAVSFAFKPFHRYMKCFGKSFKYHIFLVLSIVPAS